MLATVIISLILAAVIIMIVYNMYRKKKNGKCSCGCSACSMSDVCHGEKK